MSLPNNGGNTMALHHDVASSPAGCRKGSTYGRSVWVLPVLPGQCFLIGRVAQQLSLAPPLAGAAFMLSRHERCLTIVQEGVTLSVTAQLCPQPFFAEEGLFVIPEGPGWSARPGPSASAEEGGLMTIFAASLLSMAGSALAVVGLIALLGIIAIRRCEHEDIPAVLEALGTLVRAFGFVPVAIGSWLPNSLRPASPGEGKSDKAGKAAIHDTASVNGMVEH